MPLETLRVNLWKPVEVSYPQLLGYSTCFRGSLSPLPVIFPTQYGSRHDERQPLLLNGRVLSVPTGAIDAREAKQVDRTSGLHHRQASPTLTVLAFGAIYLIWGSTYLAIRIGLESFPPLLLGAIRHLLFGLILYLVLRWKSDVRPSAAHWRTAIVTGLLLLFIGNGGVCVAEGTVPSGVAALLVATISLWIVLIEWLRPGGSRPLPRVVAGIVLGFAGMVLLVGPAHFGDSGRVDLKGSVILVVASLSWAFGSMYAKHGQLPASPFLGVAMQSLAGGIALLIAGLFTGEFTALRMSSVSLRSCLAISYLIVFGSGLGFTAYLYLLKTTAAARVGTYALVNPVVALILGWLIAGESITLRTASAATVILTAVLLVITAPHAHPSTDLPKITLPEAGEA
jgi:drug/metabolite transporter (DMT)-like permease